MAEKKLILWTERDLLQGIKWLTILLDGTQGWSPRKNSPVHTAEPGWEGGYCSCQERESVNLLIQCVTEEPLALKSGHLFHIRKLPAKLGRHYLYFRSRPNCFPLKPSSRPARQMPQALPLLTQFIFRPQVNAFDCRNLSLFRNPSSKGVWKMSF